MYQPEYVTGGAGDMDLVNQDEKAILDACVASVPFRAVGFQEDDSHVTGPFREPEVAGS